MKRLIPAFAGGSCTGPNGMTNRGEGWLRVS